MLGGGCYNETHWNWTIQVDLKLCGNVVQHRCRIRFMIRGTWFVRDLTQNLR